MTGQAMRGGRMWMGPGAIPAAVLSAAWIVAAAPSAARGQTPDFEERVDAAKKKAVEWLLSQQRDKVRLVIGDGKDAKIQDIDAEWKDVVIVSDPATKRLTQKVKVKGTEYNDVEAVLPPGWFEGDPISKNGHGLEGIGGATCLATMALLASGVNPNTEKRLMKSVECVLYMHVAMSTKNNKDVKGSKELVPGTPFVYALGNHAAALEYALKYIKSGETHAAIRKQLDRDGKLLENGYAPNSGYHYHLGDGDYDLSCSQYGILGLWACQRANVELSEKTWKHFNQWLLDIQDRDGSWHYMGNRNDPTKDTMTTAGLASLYLLVDVLHTRNRGNGKPDVTPFEQDPLLLRTVNAVERGMEFWGRVYNAKREAYYMYGSERVGVASGYKYFGEHNWYKEGAEEILKSQDADGAWRKGAGHGGALCSTSWKLLFLVFGGAPVLINKLQYGPKGDWQWHNYPRDAGNLAHWYGHQFETLVNWQILTLSPSRESDLLDAPILYINGYKELAFTDDEVDILRRYVERGGTLLFMADGGKKPFIDSVMKLGTRLYPPEKYPERQWAEVPKEHAVYTMNTSGGKANPISKNRLMHMSDGSRSFAFLSPDDIAWVWHSNKYVGRKDAFDLIANLKTYCTDKGPLPARVRPPLTHNVPKWSGPPRPEVKVAVVQFASKGAVQMAKVPGGAPVPVAVLSDWTGCAATWRTFAEWFRHAGGGEIKETRGISLTDPSLREHDVLHMSGRYAFALSEEEKKALKSYLEGGGSLLLEPVGGLSGDFHQSATELLRSMFARDQIEPLPGGHPIITGKDGGVADVSTGGFTRQVMLTRQGLVNPAEVIKCVKINGRVAVIVTPMDISLGLAGQSCYERMGFQAKTARGLIGNWFALIKPTASQGPAKKEEKPNDKKPGDNKKPAAGGKPVMADAPAAGKPAPKPAPAPDGSQQ